MDDRVVDPERVCTGVSGLGFAAADVTARCAEAQVPGAAALLALPPGRRGDDLRRMRTRLGDLADLRHAVESIPQAQGTAAKLPHVHQR